MARVVHEHTAVPGRLRRVGACPAGLHGAPHLHPRPGPGWIDRVHGGFVRATPDLKPEVGREIETGFETDLFDRLHIDFTYYNKHTTNELVAQNVAPSSGFFGTQFQNLGQVNNYGTETELTLPIVRAPMVSWEISGNYSTARNKIISQGNIPQVITLASQDNIVGYPIMSFFSRRVVSATITNGQATSMLCDGGKGKAPVDCSVAPFEYIGSPTPTSIGAIGNTVTLMHRLRLYALVDWKGGNKQLNFVDQARCTGILGAGMCDVNFHPNKYSSTYVAESTPLAFVEQADDQFYQDASFVKLRELSATYTFPQHLIPRFQRVSVTLAARELALWTKYKGADPEVNLTPTAGVPSLVAEDQGVIPPLSYFTLTLNFGF